VCIGDHNTPWPLRLCCSYMGIFWHLTRVRTSGCVEVYRGSHYPMAATPDNDEQMRANLLVVKYLSKDGGHYQALVPKAHNLSHKAKGPSRSSGCPCVTAGPTLTELLERLDLYQVCFVLTEA
jgi:hypothetical protein